MNYKFRFSARASKLENDPSSPNITTTKMQSSPKHKALPDPRNISESNELNAVILAEPELRNTIGDKIKLGEIRSNKLEKI